MVDVAALDCPAMVFPGQGSQGSGMGSAWRRDPAWVIVEEAQEALHRYLEPMLTDPLTAPTSTTDTQLAVVLCSMMSWRALAPAVAAIAPPRHLLAGHSLGLVSALQAAGVLTVAQTVQVVALRARLTETACDGTGGMTALMLGVKEAAKACGTTTACWVANDNAPLQTVIAGTLGSLRAAEAAAVELGAEDVAPLSVAGPFHTPLMSAASEAFRSGLADIPFARSNATLVHNGHVHEVGATSGEQWRELVSADLCAPVLWRDTQQSLARLGADCVVETGYGRTLTGLAKRTLGMRRLYNATAPAACAAVAALLGESHDACPPPRPQRHGAQ